MKIYRSLIPIPKFAKVYSAPIHRTHGDPIRKGNVTTCRNSSAPNFERAEMSGGDIVARQRALVGNSLDDEQWSDDLSNPPSH